LKNINVTPDNNEYRKVKTSLMLHLYVFIAGIQL